MKAKQPELLTSMDVKNAFNGFNIEKHSVISVAYVHQWYKQAFIRTHMLRWPTIQPNKHSVIYAHWIEQQFSCIIPTKTNKCSVANVKKKNSVE